MMAPCVKLPRRARALASSNYPCPESVQSVCRARCRSRAGTWRKRSVPVLRSIAPSNLIYRPPIFPTNSRAPICARALCSRARGDEPHLNPSICLVCHPRLSISSSSLAHTIALFCVVLAARCNIAFPCSQARPRAHPFQVEPSLSRRQSPGALQVLLQWHTFTEWLGKLTANWTLAIGMVPSRLSARVIGACVCSLHSLLSTSSR